MPGKRRSHGKWLPDSNAAERAPNRSCTPRYSPLGFCASSCGTFRQLLSVCDDNEVLSGKIPFPFNALESERKCREASFFAAGQIGRASCRGRVCKFVYIPVVFDYLKIKREKLRTCE